MRPLAQTSTAVAPTANSVTSPSGQRPIAKFIGKKTKTAAISGADLSEWVEQVSTWNSTTRNDGITAVNRCFNWAVGKKFLKVDHVSIASDKPRRKRRETVLICDEWHELLGYVKDQAFRDLLTFMWEVGCRPLEARTMEAIGAD